MRPICWCARSALDAVEDEASRWRIRETGGALLGWRGRAGALIAEVLGPGPDAEHGFSSFEPDAAWQAEQGARIYRATGRQVAYLGDWHSHPRGSSRPSPTDRRTARLIAEDERFRAPQPLYAIVSRQRRFMPRWQLTVYEARATALVKLDVELVEDWMVQEKLVRPTGDGPAEGARGD